MTLGGVEAFTKLKESMFREPVLHSTDFEKPFFIHCDATSHGIGAVLVQVCMIAQWQHTGVS